ncbi:MAG: aspartyl protease family protein [Caulobacteraceae bacterium]
MSVPAFALADPAPPTLPAAEQEPVPDAVLAASVDLADRMTVPVTVNGRGPFPFVIDTGSNRTVVSDALASQLGLPSSGSLQIRAATAMAKTDSVRVASLAVGHRRLTDFKAPVLQLNNLGALGMLGIDAVADQRLVMDFRKKQMVLTKTVRQEADAGTLVVQAKSKYGQLLLVDSEVEGVPLYVIIDTGSEVTIGNSAMRSFLAKRRASRADLIDVAGETATVDLGQLPELHIGKVIVLNEQVAYADLFVFEHLGLHGKPSMLLGMSTLRKCAKVSIDFPAREVRFLLDA